MSQMRRKVPWRRRSVAQGGTEPARHALNPPLKSVISHEGNRIHRLLTHGSLGPRESTPQTLSIGSAVLAQLMLVAKRQTHRQIDGPSRYNGNNKAEMRQTRFPRGSVQVPAALDPLAVFKADYF